MIITNKLNLPAPFVSMCEQTYQTAPNEYRVTSLLKSMRECVLERRYGKEITQDVSDMVWLLFGTAAHSVLESHQETAEQFKEVRLKMPVGQYILSGKPDLYDAATYKVTDYKSTSVWKIIYRNFDDWRRQLLTYAVMLNYIGFPCNKGEIVALLKDHSKRDAKFKADYPKLPVYVVPFNFSTEDLDEGTLWIGRRIEEITSAEKLPDNELPMCTLDERYNNGNKYAVIKKGRKRALRVLDTPEEAKEWMERNGGDTIEERPGEDKKCIDYCAAAPFCSYWQEHYAGELLAAEG